jgi:hypothetical protein
MVLYQDGMRCHMAHEVLPLPVKPHRLVGLSDRLLVSHYENNDGGAIRPEYKQGEV